MRLHADEEQAMERTPEVTSHSEPPRDDAAAQLALTVRQVAAILGMTPKAVYHRAQRGQLPGKFYVGSSVRFRRADLLRFIAEGRAPPPTRSR
jgi:excisionase family DNA binding protein